MQKTFFTGQLMDLYMVGTMRDWLRLLVIHRLEEPLGETAQLLRGRVILVL